MQIKDLKINDEVSIKVSTQRLRDTDDEKWIYEPICETAKVVEVDKDGLFASIVFADGKWGELDKDTEWYPIPSSTKIATHDRPAHYGDSNKDLIDYWCERYSAEELRGAFKSQISKYVDRLGYKDDVVKELDKIIDYATRYKKHLKKVKA
ncbi:DUF3310 domain-containing protein [Staphylococcus pseudintermedius]|uniref:DUF3310 domain-containing protein n=1 Tax=Staphylococcus pseudintermedius TaxID=283734 RepID=UPI0027F8C4FB|nr:DUF3310 domain-containing protein [Staphylococcus pseudintermedius]MDQ7195600.1 DUF3310 domain-containing protein [Staphylococcus pseudintermedius]HAR6251213.1 DUF3310 domain-containing protein [Staphylococcus pseudintermedius]HAR6253238.1 DUF3310 domain-containing protein [Staphylococcus pseudintermedius]